MREKYACTPKLASKDAHIVILCYDVNEYDSFYGVLHWYETINKAGMDAENTTFILVGCKEDR